MMKVRIHCGSAHVKGKARTYKYYVASLFKPYTTKNGKAVYRNSGIHVGPFRGLKKTENLARALALHHGAEFIKGYGSLHNKKVEI